MNLFDFIERTPIELATFTFFSSIALLIFAPIGAFFMGGGKEVLTKKPLTATVIGVSVIAAALSTLVAGAAILAKLFITGVWLLSVLIIVVLSARNNFKWRGVLNSYGRCWGVSLLRYLIVLLFLVLAWITVQTSADTLALPGIRFNGHDNYFSAVPLEIYSADYWGRLRVFDNYPFAWAKYHFFNGSLISIPLWIFPEKNLVTFQLSKIVIISLMIGVILENVPRLSKWRYIAGVVVVLFATQVLSKQLWWAFYTSNFSSIFFGVSFFVALYSGNVRIALLYLATFSISTSRSLIPALVVLCTYLVVVGAVLRDGELNIRDITGIKNLARKIAREVWSWIRSLDYPFLFYLVVHLFALLAMVFGGTTTERVFREGGFIRSFLAEPWFALLSPSISYPFISIQENAFNPSPILFFIWAVGVIWISWVTGNLNSIAAAARGGGRRIFLRSSIPTRIIVLAVGAGMIYAFYKRPDSMTILFAVVALLYISFPKNSPPLIISVTLAFVATSVMQLIVFNGQLSVPNFAVLEWLTLFFVLRQLFFLKFEYLRGRIVYIIFLIIASILFLYQAPTPLAITGLFKHNNLDENTIILPYARGDKTASFYKDSQPVCDLDKPRVAALASLGGARSFFSSEKTFNTSVSVAFLKRDGKIISEIVENCSKENK